MNLISLSFLSSLVVLICQVMTKLLKEFSSIAIPPIDTLQQFMEDHENDIHMQERDELEDIFLRQPAILKHNLPVEPLGILSQPKEDRCSI